ncbi:MAG: Lrp/AsnC ligand binding domain-containing protein [Thermofilum sp.]|jgi:DNA-binding Lrp family transcriptional regulator|nr:Lrp/AsnC ligand binding domain-containing protein [Thermofilum sp.]
MVKSYILVTTKPGKEYDVAAEVKKFPFVSDVDVTYGLWDLVVRVQPPSLAELDKVITMIRSIKDVEQTVTLVSHE